MARIIDGKEMNMVGANIKRIRQEKGWSQQQLSDKLETLAVYVCRGSLRLRTKQQNLLRITELDNLLSDCIQLFHCIAHLSQQILYLQYSTKRPKIKAIFMAVSIRLLNDS